MAASFNYSNRCSNYTLHLNFLESEIQFAACQGATAVLYVHCSFNALHAGQFCCDDDFCRLLIFSNLTFKKTSRNSVNVPKGFDPLGLFGPKGFAKVMIRGIYRPQSVLKTFLRR